MTTEAPPSNENEIFWSSRNQKRALGILAIAAVFGIIWLAMPVGIGLLLGTVIAFTVEPFYHRLLRSWKRAQLAASVCVGLITLLFLGMIFIIGYLFTDRFINLATQFQTEILQKNKLLEWGIWIKKLFSALMDRLDLDPTVILSKLQVFATDQVTKLSGQATDLVTNLAKLLFNLFLTSFFLVLTMHFILRHWREVTHRAEILLPLHPRHSHALFEEFRQVGRSVLLGTILTGIAQGTLAGIGFLITGAPEAFFFGVLTAIASLVPVVGTVLVWVPIGIFLMATGHVGWGIVELLYGVTIVVGVSDYMIRPILVGRRHDHKRISALLTFIALFGGIEAFGVIGLILGPVLMAISVAILKIYERERILHQHSTYVMPTHEKQEGGPT